MKKILIVFGTRPEAIKLAPLIYALQNCKEFDTKICISAQHRTMLDEIIKFFKLNVDYDLDIMKEGQDLFDISATLLTKLKSVLRAYKPDLVLVHGDTSTAMNAALAAFYEKITIAHIEAGLRTYNIYAPYPEEANRQIISVLASLHFAPTLKAKENLMLENKKENSIIITGNTIIDALFLTLETIEKNSILKTQIQNKLKTYGIDENKKFILITAHRRENFGQGFFNICQALKEIALKYKDIFLIYPVHLNPNVYEPVYKILANISNIILIPPQSYENFIYLMSKAYFIISDSGGVQEEAPSLGKPVLLTRTLTERPEALESGILMLVGSESKNIVSKAELLLENPNHTSFNIKENPYGDGKACQRIVAFLQRYFNENK